MPGITYMLQFTRRDRENPPEVIEYMALAQDAVMRAIGRRGYLADWTNESPAQEAWR